MYILTDFIVLGIGYTHRFSVGHYHLLHDDEMMNLPVRLYLDLFR
jgi:hypothetical protein